MEIQLIEFKVGQRWKTQMGHMFIIKEIRIGEEYPLICISMNSGKKHLFDEDGYEVAGYPTDNDLMEDVSNGDRSGERTY